MSGSSSDDRKFGGLKTSSCVDRKALTEYIEREVQRQVEALSLQRVSRLHEDRSLHEGLLEARCAIQELQASNDVRDIEKEIQTQTDALALLQKRADRLDRARAEQSSCCTVS